MFGIFPNLILFYESLLEGKQYYQSKILFTSPVACHLTEHKKPKKKTHLQANISDRLFDQRSQVHREAWFPEWDKIQTLQLID